MQDIEIKNPKSIFHSPLAEALDGRCLGLDRVSISQMLHEYTLVYRRFSKSLARGVASFQTYVDKRDNDNWGDSPASPTEHIDDLLECIYHAAEVFEIYYQRIDRTLKLDNKLKRRFREKIRDYQDFWVKICNRSKHNSAYLQSIEAHYLNGEGVAGFFMYIIKGGDVLIDEVVHERYPSYSIGWAYKQLIAELLNCDFAAAKVVREMPDQGGDALATGTFTLPFIETALKIIKLPTGRMPAEGPIYDLTILGESGINVQSIRPAYNSSPQVRVQISVDLISYVIRFQKPYHSEFFNLSMTHHDGANKPIPQEMVMNLRYQLQTRTGVPPIA